jgi:hypothetical protein
MAMVRYFTSTGEMRMKVWIVSASPSIRKAVPPMGCDPFPTFFPSRQVAMEVAAHWSMTYMLDYRAYEVEAKITRKLKRHAAAGASPGG